MLVIMLMAIGMISINPSNSSALSVDTLINDTKTAVVEMKDSAVAKVNEIDTSSTFKTMYSDFKQGIVALASSLKVGAEHVYGVLVRQQIVYGIVYLIIFLMGVLLINNWIRKYKSDEEWSDGDEPTGLGVIRIFQVIVAFALLLIGIVNIDVIMTGFINPEYGAIKDVIEMVKDMQK